MGWLLIRIRRGNLPIRKIPNPVPKAPPCLGRLEVTGVGGGMVRRGREKRTRTESMQKIVSDGVKAGSKGSDRKLGGAEGGGW